MPTYFGKTFNLDTLYHVKLDEGLPYNQKFKIARLLVEYSERIRGNRFSPDSLRMDSRRFIENTLSVWETYVKRFGNANPYSPYLIIGDNEQRWGSAFSDWAFRQLSWRTKGQAWDTVLSNVANIVSSSSSDEATISFTDDLYSWKAGQFADSNSCFFGNDRLQARERMQDAGFLAMLMYTDDSEFYRRDYKNDFEIGGETYYGIGRAWLIPFLNQRNFLTVFNAYSIQSYVSTDTRRFAQLLAQFFTTDNPLLVSKFTMEIDGNEEGIIYINNGRGYAIHESAVHVPDYIDYELNINYFNTCYSCGNVAGGDPTYYEGDAYCSECANRYLVEDVNGRYVHRDNAILVHTGYLKGHDNLAWMSDADDEIAYCEHTGTYWHEDDMLPFESDSGWQISPVALASGEYTLCKSTLVYYHKDDMETPHRSYAGIVGDIGRRTTIQEVLEAFMNRRNEKLRNSTGALFYTGNSLYFENVCIGEWYQYWLNDPEVDWIPKDALRHTIWDDPNYTGVYRFMERLVAIIDLLENLDDTIRPNRTSSLHIRNTRIVRYTVEGYGTVVQYNR